MGGGRLADQRQADDDLWCAWPVAATLAGYEQTRDQAALPMYEFTTELAALGPPRVERQALFAALAGRQAEINRFLGVITGAVPIADYFTPRNLVRLLGVRGMATVMLSSCASRGRRQRRARQWQGPEARSRLCSPSRAHESTPAGWCSQRGPAPASRQVCSKAVTIPTKRSGAVLFGACLDRYEPALATAWAPASAIGSRVSPHKGVTG